VGNKSIRLGGATLKSGGNHKIKPFSFETYKVFDVKSSEKIHRRKKAKVISITQHSHKHFSKDNFKALRLQ
jgi:hypothetical protein